MTTTYTISKDSSAEAIRDKNWYSDDELTDIKVDAFKAGQKAGEKHANEQFKKDFDANLKKAKTVAEKIYVHLALGLKVNTKRIKLKHTFLNSFEAIFIVPSKDFLSSERFHLIHSISDRILKESNTADFNL